MDSIDTVLSRKEMTFVLFSRLNLLTPHSTLAAVWEHGSR